MSKILWYVLLVLCLSSCTENSNSKPTENTESSTAPITDTSSTVSVEGNQATAPDLANNNPVAQFLAKLPEVSSVQELAKNIHQTAKHKTLVLADLPDAPEADEDAQEFKLSGAGKYTFANGWTIYALCQFLKYEGEPGWNTTTLTVVDEEYSKRGELEVENMSESATQGDYTSLQGMEEDGTTDLLITINIGSASYQEGTDEGVTILYALGENGKFEKRSETAYSEKN